MSCGPLPTAEISLGELASWCLWEHQPGISAPSAQKCSHTGRCGVVWIKVALHMGPILSALLLREAHGARREGNLPQASSSPLFCAGTS